MGKRNFWNCEEYTTIFPCLAPESGKNLRLGRSKQHKYIPISEINANIFSSQTDTYTDTTGDRCTNTKAGGTKLYFYFHTDRDCFMNDAEGWTFSECARCTELLHYVYLEAEINETGIICSEHLILSLKLPIIGTRRDSVDSQQESAENQMNCLQNKNDVKCAGGIAVPVSVSTLIQLKWFPRVFRTQSNFAS